MAVALTYAPGLQLSSIMPFGAIAALLAMGLTAWQVERLGVEDFAGYPLRLQTLGLPVALALLVLLIKQIWPALGILAVIALVAPLLAPSVAAAMLLVFAIASRELVASLLLAPTGVQTVSVYVWRQFEQGSVGEGMAMSLIAIGMTALLVLLAARLAPRPGH
jgi:hypothetical protein